MDRRFVDRGSSASLEADVRFGFRNYKTGRRGSHAPFLRGKLRGVARMAKRLG